MFGNRHQVTLLEKKTTWTSEEVYKIAAKMVVVSQLPKYPCVLKVEPVISRKKVKAALGNNDFEHKILWNDDRSLPW